MKKEEEDNLYKKLVTGEEPEAPETEILELDELLKAELENKNKEHEKQQAAKVDDVTGAAPVTETDNTVSIETTKEEPNSTLQATGTNNSPDKKTEKAFREIKKGHKPDCQCAVCKSVRKKQGENTDTPQEQGAKPTKTEKPKAETTGAPADARNDLFSTLGEYKEVKPQAETPAQKAAVIEASKFINGALFLLVLDSAFPLILTTVLSFFNPKYNYITDTAKNKLKLTEKEKTLLEESANEVVKYLFAGANPVTIFFLSVGFIYYAKFETLTDSDFKAPSKKPVKKHE